MFNVARKIAIDSYIWKETGGSIDYIEAGCYENVGATTNRKVHHGFLEDDQIIAWAKKPASQSSLAQCNQNKLKIAGRIRLAICERLLHDPLDFPITQATFEALEQSFHLHPATLPSFRSHAGIFSRYLTFCEDDPSRLTKISFILKAPHKRGIANYGLSLSHDVDSNITTAMLYGMNVTWRDDLQDDRHRNGKMPYPYPKSSEHQFSSPVSALMEFLQETSYAWNHPLLLPSLILQHHMGLTRAFANYGMITDEAYRIEKELGVTISGHPVESSVTPTKGNDFRSKAEKLTVDINTHSTRILFTSRSPEWNSKCTQFTLDLLTTLRPYLLGQDTVHHELKEFLELNLAWAEVAIHDIASVRGRMTLQLNVLYNLVAQMDNALNAQLAAAAGRDSTSMKILAFISAIFLPGSFVAGIFSTGMFNWNYTVNNSGSAGDTSGPAEGGVVSQRFWIYWVIAVPLTLVTLLGWAFWWRVEMRRFQQRFKAVMSSTETQAPETEAIDEMEEKKLSWYSGLRKRRDGLV